MKKLIIIIFILNLFYLHSDEIDISKVDFVGVSVSKYLETIDDPKKDIQYNVCYSAILPADGIYCIKDASTGKESIVQIGNAVINQSPYILYISDDLFKFFTKDKKMDKINLTVKFIGWNKIGESSQFLDIQSLIISPEKSMTEIMKNGIDKYYIQLGAYSYYQNAYPGITELMPFLQIRPNFYFIKKEIKIGSETKTVYNVVAGPYAKKDAGAIINLLNNQKSKTVILKSLDTILNEEKQNKK